MNNNYFDRLREEMTEKRNEIALELMDIDYFVDEMTPQDIADVRHNYDIRAEEIIYDLYDYSFRD